MTEPFLEIDEVLEALTDELSRFKSSTEQLRLSHESASSLVDSIQKQSELVAELAARSQQQLEAMTRLTEVTEANVSHAAQQQQAFAASVIEKLEDVHITLVDQQALLASITSKLEANETAVGEIQKVLKRDVEPRVAQVEGVAHSSQNLIRLILLLVLANLAVGGYLLVVLR